MFVRGCKLKEGNSKMYYKKSILSFFISFAVFSKLAWAGDVPQPNGLPYDYEINEKCDRGVIQGSICSQFSYYRADAFDSDTQAALLEAQKTLRPDESPEFMSYGPLGNRGQAKIWLGMSDPENVATYIIFTLINGKLVDHQVIGIDYMELGAVKRDFMIDKSYRIFVYSRKPNTGIKSPRRLVSTYQILPDGKIAALK
jgi:hypothetical protein